MHSQVQRRKDADSMVNNVFFVLRGEKNNEVCEYRIKMKNYAFSTTLIHGTTRNAVCS